ncbi:MAG: YggS family pyridoxal phosphate-dependent enzyme [Bdellovibrionales bacterium]|nr:YggS family pyridoxal phosphate-dependent enzyme [Bdellovibrionales bacterium]
MTKNDQLQTSFLAVLDAVRSVQCRQTPQIVAVSKRQHLEKMLAWEKFCEAHALSIVFGENYVQELVQKRQSNQLSGASRIHLIGPLQSNKVKDAVTYADVIESVHSQKVLEKIIAEARKQQRTPEIFLQVNISHDAAKSGFSEDEIEALVRQCRHTSAIVLRGLMTITQHYGDPEGAREDYRRMKTLAEAVQGSEVLELSMGMSADFQIAIEEGASFVRIGSALFGERLPNLP